MFTPFTARDAIRIATTWITSSDHDFFAGFIGGSIAHADQESYYDPTSDVDCYLVTEGEPPDGKIGKISVEGVLMDVSWLSWKQLQAAESDAVLASLIHFGRVVRDDGRLGALQQDISDTFRQPEMITARLESMRAKIRNGLATDSTHLSEPEQVMNWLFPTTLATHIPLIAACAPLTVRKRFLAAKQVMDPEGYEELLALFGFDTVTVEKAQRWLDETANLFDATAELAEDSSRFWATDIQANARHIAIDASQHLIEGGNHREALYWIIATSARCLTVRTDAGAKSIRFLHAFTAMLAEIGIESGGQRQTRSLAIFEWIG